MAAPTFKQTDDVVAQIKQHSLSEYIGRDAKLERVGGEYRCSSPVRSGDSDPSFFIFDNDTRWWDFGINEGGDVFNYVMKRDHCDFKEALNTLCEHYDIERKWKNSSAAPEEQDELDKELRRLTERHAVFDIFSEAAKYWHDHCPTKIREFVRDHYGLTEEIITRLQIGYAHGSCYKYLIEKGYSKEMLIKSGLFLESSDGRVASFYQNRITFPYWVKGQVVYMAGRETEWTDTTLEYEKKRKYKKALTYGDSFKKVSIHVRNDWFYNEDICNKKLERITITEGVSDCISLMQIDEPCISPVTTKFKKSTIPRLVDLLKRCQAKTIYICNDSEYKLNEVTGKIERPGHAGALATAEELIKAGLVVKVCELPLPEGETKIDLNEFCKKHGALAPNEFEKILTAAKPFNDFKIDSIPLGLSPEDLAKELQSILDLNASAHLLVKDSVEKKIRARFGLSASLSKQLMRSVKAPERVEDEPKKIDKKEGRTNRVKGKILEDTDHYWIEERNGDSTEISNFTVKATKRLLLDKESLLVGELTNHKNHKKEITFPNVAWTSRKEFIRSLRDSRFSWKGTDDHVQDLMEKLSTIELPFKHATPVLGYNCRDGIPKWIWSEGSIYADKFISNADADILYLPDGSNVDRRFKYQDTDSLEVRELAAAVIPLLLKVNEPGTILPIIGWFFATPYKYRLRNALGHFPILFVWGSMGSGKTSLLRDIFWALFGVKDQSEPYSCTDTSFAIVKKLCSTNGCPIIMDEHKPSDMPHGRAEQLHRLIRRAYSGEAEERGRTDLSIQSSELQAPWCIAGETSPDDPATKERLLQVCPNRRFIDNNTEARDAFRTLRNMPLEKLTASYIQFTLKKDDITAELVDAREWTDTYVKRLSMTSVVAPRIYDNILCSVFGLFRFKAWAKSVGVDCEFDASEIVKSVVTEHTDGSVVATKDAFDSFVEYIGVLLMHGNSHPGSITAPQKILREGEAYAWTRNHNLKKTTICFHLDTCYRIYCIERNKSGHKDDTGGIKALKRLMKEKLAHDELAKKGTVSYIVNDDKRVRMEGGFLRCFELDLDVARQCIRFPDIDVGKERSHGGVGEGRHEPSYQDDGSR